MTSQYGHVYFVLASCEVVEISEILPQNAVLQVVNSVMFNISDSPISRCQ